MQSRPSFVYADPNIGAIATNLGDALFGNPDNIARDNYYRAHADQATATADKTRAEAAARSRVTSSLQSLFAPIEPGQDPRAVIQSRLAGVGGPMFESGDNGAAAQLSQLATLFMGLQPGADNARTSLVLGGHAPDKNFAPDQATADANAARDFANEKAIRDSTANIAADAQRYGDDTRLTGTKYTADSSAKSADNVAHINADAAQHRQDTAPLILSRDQEYHGSKADPSVAPIFTGNRSEGSVKADALANLFSDNPPDYTDDQRRALGLQVKEGAERQQRIIKLAPDQIAVGEDGKLIAEGKPGNTARQGARPVRVGPYDSVLAPDGKTVLYQGQQKPAAAAKPVKVDPKSLDAAEGRIAEALGVDSSELAGMISQLSAPELKQYSEAVTNGFQSEGGDIPGAVAGGANFLRERFNVAPGTLWGHNIKRIAPGASQAAPAGAAAPQGAQPPAPPADPKMRKPGVYSTPRGPMGWTGTGWVTPQEFQAKLAGGA